MKGGTIQISWHGSDPVLSLDFHPSGLLASAGADRDIKLWSLHYAEKSKVLPSAKFKANLSYHSSAVNVVRFSPSGELLASGADLGELVLWRQTQAEGEGGAAAAWKVWKTLRFHLKDVLDLDWSADGSLLVSASVDNTCIVWDVGRGAVEQVLSGHEHYVQGVAWDPLGKYIVSLSSDRSCRFYSARVPSKSLKGKARKEDNQRKGFECQHVMIKRDASVVGAAPASKQYLFYDENMASFFRRLAWSPEGSFLLLPAGFDKRSAETALCSMTYLLSRKELLKSSPQVTLQLPAGSKPVIGVRFCPVRFVLRPKNSGVLGPFPSEVGIFQLPYKLVFAVATVSSVFIYDTQGSCPVAVFSGLHYAPITDLAWSCDGKFLAVSSQDGYCTLIAFDNGDLGVAIPGPESDAGLCSTASPGSDHRNNAPLVQEKSPSESASLFPGYFTDVAGASVGIASVKQRPQVPHIRRVTPKPLDDSPEAVSGGKSLLVDMCSAPMPGKLVN